MFDKKLMENVMNEVNSRSREWFNEFSAKVLFEFGDRSYLLKVFEGKILDIKEDPPWTEGWDFALRGRAEEWDKFMRRAPLHNDLFACLRRGFLKIEGDAELAMGNIRALMEILEIMRGEYEKWRR